VQDDISELHVHLVSEAYDAMSSDLRVCISYVSFCYNNNNTRR